MPTRTAQAASARPAGARVSARERFEPRVRRNIEEYALELARSGHARRKNGIELEPGEFTTRDAEVAALAGNHMREKARRIVEAMTAEGVLVETRRIKRGSGQEWVLRKVSPAWLAASLRDHWEPDEEDVLAFEAAVGAGISRVPARVLRNVAPGRTAVIPVRGEGPSGATYPNGRQNLKNLNERDSLPYRLLTKIEEAERRGFTVPDIADVKLLTRLLNRILHQPPDWLWRMGEPAPGLMEWTQQQEDLMAERFRDR